jgi:Secretion system C-terminal sorting domain
LKIDLTDKILKNNDQIISPEILIYPNPARDYLHIQSELPYDLIQIIDLLGTMILEEKGKPHLNINVKELPLGYYMVRIIFSNHKTYSHLIYHITN